MCTDCGQAFVRCSGLQGPPEDALGRAPQLRHGPGSAGLPAEVLAARGEAP